MKPTWIVPFIIVGCLVTWSQDCSAGFPRVFRWFGEGWSDGYHAPNEHWNQPHKAAWTIPMPAIHTYPIHTHPWRSVPHNQAVPSREGEPLFRESIPMERVQPGPMSEEIPLEVYTPGPSHGRGFLPPN